MALVRTRKEGPRTEKTPRDERECASGDQSERVRGVRKSERKWP